MMYLLFIVSSFILNAEVIKLEDRKDIKINLIDFNTYSSCKKKNPNTFINNNIFQERSINEPEFKNYLQIELKKNRISESTIKSILNNAKYLEEPIKKQNSQAEIKKDFRYYSNDIYKVNNNETLERISNFYKANKEIFNKVEERYKIEKEILLSVMYFETKLGTVIGSYRIVDALYTLSINFKGTLRGDMFMSNLIYFAKLVDKKILKISSFSSWAGAVGLTQFMPENIVKYGVKYKEDANKIDLYSVEDSVSSTANFLNKMGWTYRMPILIDVKIPEDLDICNVGFNVSKNIKDWNNMGVDVNFEDKNINIKDLEFVLIAPDINNEVNNKDYFLSSSNFKVLLKYNKSTLYAASMAILYNNLKKMNLA